MPFSLQQVHRVDVEFHGLKRQRVARGCGGGGFWRAGSPAVSLAVSLWVAVWGPGWPSLSLPAWLPT